MRRPRATLLVAALVQAGCGDAALELPVVPPPLDLERLDLEVQRRHAELSRRVAAADAAAPVEAAEAYGRLGIFLLAHDALDAAGVCFETAQRLAPREPRWSSYLGFVELRRGRLPEARRAFERRLRRDPDDEATRLWAAEVDLSLGEAGAAAQRLAPLVADPAAGVPALAQLARVRLQQDRAREALELLARAAAAGGRSGVLAHLEAEAHRKLGDVDAAARALDGVAAGGSVRALLAAGDPLLQAVAAERRGARRHDERAIEALQRGQLELALVELGQALRTDPDRVYARLDTADVLVRLGREEEAVAQLETLLATVPDYPPALRRLGELALRRGRLAEAGGLLQRALERDPLDGAAWVARGELERARGAPEAAAADYHRALELDPGDTAAAVGLARCHLAAGAEARAVETLATALEARGGAPRAELLLARLLALSRRAPDPARARALVSAASEQDERVFVVETLAMVAAANGELARAIDLQGRAVAAASGERERQRAGARLLAYERGELPAAALAPDEPFG